MLRGKGVNMSEYFLENLRADPFSKKLFNDGNGGYLVYSGYSFGNPFEAYLMPLDQFIKREIPKPGKETE